MNAAQLTNQLLETTKSEQVLTLPAHLFFMERIEIPAVVEAAELDDFAELSLESIAPFPADQLFWGYLEAEASDHILLYAAHRDRIKQLGVEQIEEYAWVLPEFGSLVCTFFSEATEVIVHSTESVCLLQFEKGHGVPTYVSVRATTENDDANQVIETLRKAAPELDAGHPSLTLHPTSEELTEQGLAVFNFSVTGKYPSGDDVAKLAQLSPEAAQLWRADVRGTEFKKAERNARRLGDLLLRITTWAALFAVLLILGELALFTANTWLKTRENKIIEQQPIVDKISEKRTLMGKLEQSEQNDLQPIAMLRELNKSRPSGIYFTKAIVEGENQIKIDGIANNVNAMNTYTSSLEASGLFELLNPPKSITRSGKTTFTLILSFSPREEMSDPTTPAQQVTPPEEEIDA